MTEAEEWEGSPDAIRLLALLGERLTLRGARLLIAGYCRTRPNSLAPELPADLPELIERVAEGKELQGRLASVLRQGSGYYWPYAHDALIENPRSVEHYRNFEEPLSARFEALLRALDRGPAVAHASARVGPAPADAHPEHPWHPTFQAAYFEYLKPQADLLRCLFANPCRPPVVFSPSCRTSTATALAAQMYKSRDFSAMPILADALQDAGCDSADVLDHCRGPGPHVRGCWVVDLVLGKE